MTALSRPTLDLYESWVACVDEFASEPGHIHASATWLLDREPETSREYCADLIAAIEANAEPSRVQPDDIVPADTFWVTQDDVVIGFLQLRHHLNDRLLERGGHIGFSIRPSHRRRGHAARALHLALDRARGLALDQVLVACHDDNPPSARTIESAGGVLEDTRAGVCRYWIAL